MTSGTDAESTMMLMLKWVSSSEKPDRESRSEPLKVKIFDKSGDFCENAHQIFNNNE